MRHMIVCFLLMGIVSSCVSPLSQVPEARSIESAPASVTIHIVKEGLADVDNWYDHRFGHSQGADVGVAAKREATGAVTISIESVPGRKTSGQALTITLSRDKQGATVGLVTGTWWYDFGHEKRPPMGLLTEIVAHIYLARELGEEIGMRVRFVVTAKIKDKPVLLMGGVTVPLTK